MKMDDLNDMVFDWIGRWVPLPMLTLLVLLFLTMIVDLSCQALRVDVK